MPVLVYHSVSPIGNCSGFVFTRCSALVGLLVLRLIAKWSNGDTTMTIRWQTNHITKTIQRQYTMTISWQYDDNIITIWQQYNDKYVDNGWSELVGEQWLNKEDDNWQYGSNAFTSAAHNAPAFGLTTTVINTLFFKQLLLRIFLYPLCVTQWGLSVWDFKPCLLCGAVSGHYCFHSFAPAYLMEGLQWVRGKNRSSLSPNQTKQTNKHNWQRKTKQTNTIDREKQTNKQNALKSYGGAAMGAWQE